MNKYMMATKAFHQLGEISRDEGDICHIHDETDEHYIGSWVTGFGFIGVRFPKETTRKLTLEEVLRYSRCRYQIGSQPSFDLDLTNGGDGGGNDC